MVSLLSITLRLFRHGKQNEGLRIIIIIKYPSDCTCMIEHCSLCKFVFRSELVHVRPSGQRFDSMFAALLITTSLLLNASAIQLLIA